MGLLAHVDAGKTTLSEAILYCSGSIRKLGRVDKKDAFLDSFELERERGITIFSKQAIFRQGDLSVTLLDTPGHVDFSAEMERCLGVLDTAVLVISGTDGIQAHTRTLISLLERYRVPTFVFINKMDQQNRGREMLLAELRASLGDGCVDLSDYDFENPDSEILENIALCDETILEQYLETGTADEDRIRKIIAKRKLFPCYFGSALRLEGVEAFLKGLERLAPRGEYRNEFAAKVYKITRDEKGNRLTWMKLTGGSLQIRDELCGEKVSQIRLYSGNKYEAVERVYAGAVCAVTGLTESLPGKGLGAESDIISPFLVPVLTYRIILPEGVLPAAVMPELRCLEEEEPELHIIWDEKLKELQVQIMGEVQLEILQRRLAERFGLNVEFDKGSILYKETIADSVLGVGHFEPLKHYAEVQLLLEPGERGSGIRTFSACDSDELDINWQRLVLTHLNEKEHKGVLTGAGLTDVRITLVAGRAHIKHTEGGDFRQATYRAVRQGLMKAESRLLEPYYEFTLELPRNLVGRAMSDIDRKSGRITAQYETGISAAGNEGTNGAFLASDMVVLTGRAPAATMQGYRQEVIAYSGGLGRLDCTFWGYEAAHNEDEIIASCGYNPDSDLANPASSVFCSHGAGFVVEWNEVDNYKHIDFSFKKKQNTAVNEVVRVVDDEWMSVEEVDSIIDRTFNANKRTQAQVNRYRKHKSDLQRAQGSVYRGHEAPANDEREKYLLVDGYNIIFAWEELNALAQDNIDGAREKLIDILCNYQAMHDYKLIAVFDAYRVAGHPEEAIRYHNINIVYTREAETADKFIERFAHEHGRKYNVTVATSDGMEQIIIRGQGCRLLTARDLHDEVYRTGERIRSELNTNTEKCTENIGELLPDEIKRKMNTD